MTYTQFKLKHICIFEGIGNPEAKTIPMFDGLTEDQGYYTSKSFLPKVSILTFCCINTNSIFSYPLTCKSYNSAVSKFSNAV